MTLEELQKRYPTATTETWHQHANGGGWVENTAHVDETAYVGADAVVYGQAKVHGQARVSGHAIVYGQAVVSGQAVVYGQARVSGQAKVYDQAVVYEQAVVRGQAKVCGQAVVCGQANVVNGVWRRSPLQIGGTLHWVSESAPGVLRIGCSEHTVSEWMEQGESIGREHDYTDAEIAEYRLYVELFAALEQLREESDEHN